MAENKSSDISLQNKSIFLTCGAILPAMPKKETLQDYVARKCRENGDADGPLTPAQIQRNSRGEITDSYVRDILAGRSKNMTVEKAVTLARAMNAPEDELLDILRGRTPTESDRRRHKVASIFDRAEELDDADDQHWFQSTIEMVDRELERRRLLRLKQIS
jgi:transcriptional regulator with XRE-family HTH domain